MLTLISFIVNYPGRQYHLRTENPTEKNSWIEALQIASKFVQEKERSKNQENMNELM